MATAASARTLTPFSRRHLLLTGTLGLAAAASLSAVAPASAAVLDTETSAETWTEEFLTRAETREGFVLDAMDDWQLENAKFIIAVVKGHELGEEVAVIALITAIVESWLYNYEPAVDADSGGLFQQRPSMGWGSYDEVRHKKHALDAFLGLGEHAQAPGLLQAVSDPATWDAGAAAQTVQASAHPERYAEQIGAAREIWDRFAADVEPYTA
ncbi:hypothetical protein [Brachybacterium sp.]|uniref:hypothetical protein n=1 Tax=Brachybacterium sp. TaxID=1891286 RepID=UPI00264F4AB3|nr:hypothetical protein [Brachybacterium sp.]